MQAIAPSSSLALHAGHQFGAAAGGGAGGRGGAGGAEGRVATAAPPALAAAGGGGGAAPPTVNGFWQNGQRNCLPAALSASWICWVQCGQRITIGMVVSSWCQSV